MQRGLLHQTRAVGVIGAAAVLLVTLCAGAAAAGQSSTAKATTTTVAVPTVPPIPSPPNSLIAEAKREGKLVWYTGIITAVTLTEITNDFQAKYPGVALQIVPESSSGLQAKWLANAQAGDQQADDIMTGYSSFYATSLHAGYLIPMGKVIPGFTSHYPKQYLEAAGTTGIVFTIANGFAYNKSLVPSSLIPTKYADFANPAWKGHLITVDPNASIAFLEFWDMLLHKLGKKIVQQIGANVAPNQTYSTFPPEAQALSAGEGWAALQMTANTLQPLQAAGAPVVYVQPALSTGPSYALGVSKQAPDPAAAKLFAYWCYSKAGEKDFALADGGGAPLYERALPSQWYPPNFAASSEKTEIDALLNVGPN